MDKLNILYACSAKLSCKTDKSTAFLIEPKRAICTRHGVKYALSEDSAVNLTFYDDKGKEVVRTAVVLNESEEYDIAILELNEPIEYLSEFIQINAFEVTTDVKEWELTGFPKNWNSSKEKSNYCYIKGGVYLGKTYENTRYDIQLTSPYIKEDWEYSLGGLSGSVLLVNGYIAAIITNEEYSAINAPLKAVSFYKAKGFLEDSRVKVVSQNYLSEEERKEKFDKTILGKRLNKQINLCDTILQKHKEIVCTDGRCINLEYYYIALDSNGRPKVGELVTHLTEVLNEYACSMAEIEDSHNYIPIFRGVTQCIKDIKDKGELGRIMLWMLVEGVKKAPKLFTRIEDNEESDNEVHIKIDPQDKKPILYMGKGILHSSIDEACSQVAKAFVKEFYISTDYKKIIDDTYIPDMATINQLEDVELVEVVNDFISNSEFDWSKVKVNSVIFTGYNSKIYECNESICKHGADFILEYMKKKYDKECEANTGIICKNIEEDIQLKEINLCWFMLPFKTVEEFEKAVINAVVGGEM